MSRNTKIITFLLVLVVAAAVLLLWKQFYHPQTELKIGVILSLTGDVGAYGQRSLKGLTVATHEINAQGGIRGRQITLMIEDAKSSPRDAVSAFTKLVDLNRLRIIIGDVLSGTTLAIAPIAESKRVLLFAPGASNPSLRDAGDFFFRNWVSDDYDGKAMAHYMFENGVSNVFILNQQTDYCVGLADAFQSEFRKLGGRIEEREGFITESTDFRAQLVKLQRVGSEAAYLIGESRQDGTILRQAREMGIKTRWFSNLTVDTPECQAIAGPAREGVVFTTPAFDPSSNLPQVRRFVDDYHREYKEEPDVTSGVAYDALMILSSVMEKVGDDPEQIKTALYNVKQFPGVTGLTSFDDHGDVVKNIYVKVIRNDQATLLKEFAF